MHAIHRRPQQFTEKKKKQKEKKTGRRRLFQRLKTATAKHDVLTCANDTTF